MGLLLTLPLFLVDGELSVPKFVVDLFKDLSHEIEVSHLFLIE